MDVQTQIDVQTRELRRRLDQVERTLEQLARQRHAQTQVSRETRLVKTIADGSDYPVNGNTFPFQFADGEFDHEAGDQTITWTARGGTSVVHGFGRSLLGDYILEDSYVWAHHIRGPRQDPEADVGEWWLSSNVAFLCRAVSPISKGSSGYVKIWRDSTTETDAQISALALFAGVATGKWCVLQMLDRVYYVAQVEC